MSNSIIFTSVKTHADNKKLEVDDKGYYKVILGAVDAFNESGDFYLSEGLKELITEDSSSLARRLKAGYLKGEAGHPVYEQGMSNADYFSRNLRIHLPNTSHHIREIILTPTNSDSGLPGKGKTILVEGWIKPSGPHGDALKKDLDNPDCNVAFSIRSFTQDTKVNGINIKKLAQIVTWDWVLEPGIRKANKWEKLSMEAFEYKFNIDDIVNNGKINECLNCSLESNDEKELVNELIVTINKNLSKKIECLKKW